MCGMEGLIASLRVWALQKVKQMSMGFTKSKADSNLYYKVVDDGLMILLLYVDDLFLTREEKLISECKKKLAAEFEMKDLGMMHYFLGIEVW